MAPKAGKRFMRLARVEAITRGPLRDHNNQNPLTFDPTIPCLDYQTQKQLRQLLPGLLWVSRAWHARFLTKGCLACKRKKVSYGSGGMCQSCVGANRGWIKKFIEAAQANRDTAQEIAGLSLKFDAAQLLLNGDG